MAICDDLAAEYDRLRMLRMDLLSDLEANRIALDKVLLAMANAQDIEDSCQSTDGA